MTQTLLKTYDFSEVKSLYESATEKTLCAFDVDQVLIDPKDAVLSAIGEEMKLYYLNLLKEKYSEAEYDHYYSILVKEREVEILDPQMQQMIYHLQSRQVPVFALTAFWDGPYGVIENIGDSRVLQLKNLGYDFSTSQPLSDRVFGELKSHRLALSPALKKGVLLTCHVSKGQVLEAYINALASRPEQVIFIDDRITYIEQVLESCQKMGMPCQAIHYLGAEKKGKVLDEALATFQWDYFFANQRWLSEADAIKLMANVG